MDRPSLSPSLCALVVALVGAVAHADDVAVVVKRGNLIATGERGGEVALTVTPTVTPTAAGLRIEGGAGTTINGQDGPFETDEVTGAWKLRFARTKRLTLTVAAPGEGIDAATPSKVTLFSGAHADISVAGLDIDGKLKIDLRRARDLIDLEVADTTVGGALKVSLGPRDEALDVTIRDCVVTGALALAGRAQKGSAGRNERISVLDCDVGSLSLSTVRISSRVFFERSRVAGDVRFRTDMDLFLDDVTVGGDFSAASNFHEQELTLAGLSVAGRTTLVTGAENDTVTISDSDLGKLTFRAGKGNDLLRTTDVTFGPGSKYDGSQGKGDQWRTSGPLDALRTQRVEDAALLPQ